MARVLATVAVAVACTAGTSAPETPIMLTGDEILARVKAAFRAHVRPPFISYTLIRRDRHNGLPDLENSYALKVWCRTSDRSALVRRAWRGKAYGALQNITVTFDSDVDPGPPTADMLERRAVRVVSAKRDGGAPAAESTPAPLPGEIALLEIGRVKTPDPDYRVRAAREAELLHLWLEPKIDPNRNRLDELWVDAYTYELRRALVRDHLYLGLGGQSLEDEFDVRFKSDPDGLPLIAAIRGHTKYDQFETDYTFEDVTFPPTLPDWYFAPRLYGLHVDDAPG